MSDVKPWRKSKTILASLLALIGVGLAGYELSVDDQAAIANAIGAILTLGGALTAIWGRVVASKPIGKA